MLCRRQFSIGLAALAGAAAGHIPPALAAAAAAAQTLRFGSISSAGSAAYAQMLEPFARGIEKASNGRLEVALKPTGNYGKATDLLPMVEKGDIEMAATVQGYHPGRFPRSSVMELPMLCDSAVVGTKAMVGLFKEGLIAADYASIKTVALYVSPPFGLMTTGRKITSLRDFRGLRIRTPGPTVGLALARLGAIPIGVPLSGISAAISGGMVDAVATSLDTALGTKGADGKSIADQLSVTVDLRLAATGQLVAMNKEKWDALPPDLQAIVDAQATDFVSNGTRLREEAEAAARRKLASDPGHTFLAVSPQLHEELRQAMAPAYDDWKADMTRHGIDGDKLLSRAQALVQQFSVAAK